jgi:hypothetical protein
MASYLTDLWDRFPHLLITSPGGRCGKTRLLELLEQICPNAIQVGGASAAYVYRRIKRAKDQGKLGPTILLDEAQSLNWKGDERSLKLRALFYSSIGRNAKQGLCDTSSQSYDPEDFPTYCPKAAAHIGKPDRLLADRSILAPMRRMTKAEKATLKRCRMGVWEAEGSSIGIELLEWSDSSNLKKKAKEVYDRLDLLDIENDRLAELLLPLQAVLTVLDQPEALEVLADYAGGIEGMGREAEAKSESVRLLAALRDIFARSGQDHLGTDRLLSELVQRCEEDWDWGACNNGRPITRERMSNLLEEYDIKPRKDYQRRTASGNPPRGYFACDFRDAWRRWLPTTGEIPSIPSIPSTADEGGE